MAEHDAQEHSARTMTVTLHVSPEYADAAGSLCVAVNKYRVFGQTRDLSVPQMLQLIVSNYAAYVNLIGRGARESIEERDTGSFTPAGALPAQETMNRADRTQTIQIEVPTGDLRILQRSHFDFPQALDAGIAIFEQSTRGNVMRLDLPGETLLYPFVTGPTASQQANT